MRPALILAIVDADVIVAFITTQQKWEKEAFCITVVPQPENGLKKISYLRMSKISTLDKELVIGKLGCLAENQLLAARNQLKALFEFN